MKTCANCGKLGKICGEPGYFEHCKSEGFVHWQPKPTPFLMPSFQLVDTPASDTVLTDEVNKSERADKIIMMIAQNFKDVPVADLHDGVMCALDEQAAHTRQSFAPDLSDALRWRGFVGRYSGDGEEVRN